MPRASFKTLSFESTSSLALFGFSRALYSGSACAWSDKSGEMLNVSSNSSYRCLHVHTPIQGHKWVVRRRWRWRVALYFRCFNANANVNANANANVNANRGRATMVQSHTYTRWSVFFRRPPEHASVKKEFNVRWFGSRPASTIPVLYISQNYTRGAVSAAHRKHNNSACSQSYKAKVKQAPQ